MEFVSGIKLRDILLDNGNWWKFFLKHFHLIRFGIIFNVVKLLVCRTRLLGFHIFKCPGCGKRKNVPNSCKSRFCSSCGKKATDNWIQSAWNRLPKTIWQHITFTLPQSLMDIIWLNRYLMNEIPPIAAGIILELSKKKGFLPGIFSAIHTFGRPLNKNLHFHLSVTIGGLSLDYTKWVKYAYFWHESVKNMWRYRVIKLLRDKYKAGMLKLPLKLCYIRSYSSFYKWTSKLYDVTWVVDLGEHEEDMKKNVDYLGRYLKRPPIGETRIKKYDKKEVTYEYWDHKTKTKKLMTLPVLDFIARLITHIPDKYFRNIRYYGFLSNRLSGKLMPKVYNFLNMKTPNKKVYISWRQLIKKTYNFDPLECPKCKSVMRLVSHVVPHKISYLIGIHETIATQNFPLLC